jgi:S-adenosylmethionine-diacylglycerol 3-amino-3-carboxypropyl transferase
MADRFFRTLNYASVNEDWRTEAAALRPAEGDALLCVTGSGDRPLDLLAVAPMKVLAVDQNPAQSHLLRLKVAALRVFPFDDYASFLGLRPADARWRRERLDDLGPELPPETRAFWDDRWGLVAAGVLYQGRWERFHRRVSRLARLLRPRAIDALFACETLDEQRHFVERAWDTPAWRRVFDLVCGRLVSRLFLGDPAYYRHAREKPGAYLYERMRSSLERYLARESFMMSLVLRGRLTPLDLPPYLTPEGAETIRRRLDRLEIATGDVLDTLELAPPGAFDRFSLSDLPSFLGEADFRRALRGLSRCAAPGARFCIRQFLVRHPWPEDGFESLQREGGLEARLAVEDRAFAYDFFAGEVRDD